ncbi:hypothetical protein IV203_008005 [Nitzschia inconspicua]|uniref:Cyclic nucleotide-binding domain-containing protein n=1 Tax=Nitzschia inconspicua TaxID=303405 RepID=A0A9K3PLN3_9STRA|nr:hypothetical protein IV203_008005 [Nitzschia inconspicua]
MNNPRFSLSTDEMRKHTSKIRADGRFNTDEIECDDNAREDEATDLPVAMVALLRSQSTPVRFGFQDNNSGATKSRKARDHAPKFGNRKRQNFESRTKLARHCGKQSCYRRGRKNILSLRFNWVMAWRQRWITGRIYDQDDVDPATGRLKMNVRTRVHVRAHASAVMRMIGTAVVGKDQDTEDAWEQAYMSISDLIKRPSKRLEPEPLMGWGTVMMVACTYFTLVTPFRFAGFNNGLPRIILILDILDFAASMVMLLDLIIDTIQTKFRVSRKRFVDAESYMEEDNHRNDQLGAAVVSCQSSVGLFVEKVVSNYRKKILKMLRLYRMDRWVPWPTLDMKVLVSFVLQGMVVQSPLCTRPGLHWTQMFGLLRVSCASRVLHFIQCAENNFLLRQKMDAERQLFLRIVKLLIQFAFITHVCLASTVLQQGLKLETMPRNLLLLHWTFVSLSGIGNIDSVPSTTLECWLTLIVHMIGAKFSAIVTGVVINTLEERAAKDSKIGSDVARLSKYLTTTRMSRSAKERVMKGYMMRNVLTENDAVDAGSRMDSLDHDDEILETLPNYLKTEVSIYARAEMIHRREKLFLHCSNGCLVALSSAMVRSRTLISGDYLMKEGKPFLRDFYVIEKGSLQVQRGNHTIKTLQRGQCIGRSWLLQLQNESRGPLDYGENTGWLLPDGVAACSIRAVGRCILMDGLSTLESIVALESQYSVDFQFLRADVRGYEKNESERKAKAIRGIIKAVRRFKEQKRLSRETQNVTVPTSGDKKTE